MGETVARFTLVFRGDPIGEVTLDILEDMGGGQLEPFPAFEAIRAVLSDAWRARSNYGFLPPVGEMTGGVNPDGDRDGRAVMARAEALFREMALRDDSGGDFPIRHVWLFGGRTPAEPFCLLADFEDPSPPDGI